MSIDPGRVLGWLITASYMLLSIPHAIGQSEYSLNNADSFETTRKLLESRHFILLDDNQVFYIIVDSSNISAFFKDLSCRKDTNDVSHWLPYNLYGGSFRTPLNECRIKSVRSGFRLEIRTGINIRIAFYIRDDREAFATMSTSRRSGLFNGQSEISLHGKLTPLTPLMPLKYRWKIN